MSPSENRAVALLREQLRAAWETLEGTAADLTPGVAHWIPPGTALPIGAAYAHVLLTQDGVVNKLILGARPLYAGDFAGRTGASELPPGAERSDPAPADPAGWSRLFSEWCRRVRVDLELLHAYGAAVFEAADAGLGALSDEDLERTVDLSSIGAGRQTIAFTMHAVVIGHAYCHTGEIAALKGFQGLKGYPY